MLADPFLSSCSDKVILLSLQFTNIASFQKPECLVVSISKCMAFFYSLVFNILPPFAEVHFQDCSHSLPNLVTP